VTFRDIFAKILEEKNCEEEGTVRETIARSILDKACGGDISAVKFLREVVDNDAEDTQISEIRISVIDGGKNE